MIHAQDTAPRAIVLRNGKFFIDSSLGSKNRNMKVCPINARAGSYFHCMPVSLSSRIIHFAKVKKILNNTKFFEPVLLIIKNG